MECSIGHLLRAIGVDGDENIAVHHRVPGLFAKDETGLPIDVVAGLESSGPQHDGDVSNFLGGNVDNAGAGSVSRYCCCCCCCCFCSGVFLLPVHPRGKVFGQGNRAGGVQGRVHVGGFGPLCQEHPPKGFEDFPGVEHLVRMSDALLEAHARVFSVRRSVVVVVVVVLVLIVRAGGSGILPAAAIAASASATPAALVEHLPGLDDHQCDQIPTQPEPIVAEVSLHDVDAFLDLQPVSDRPTDRMVHVREKGRRGSQSVGLSHRHQRFR
mmetsp:Transcript_13275/g.31023  ORF Transcript_13275/g.31023 Transcript_13275/m.31023 type:complete len:269 (+) Transcript_13275:506-1312(+)